MKNLLHRFNQLNRKRKGLTFIELLITITIIAIAAVIGFVSNNYIKHSRNIVCETNLSQIEKHYELDVVMKR